MFFHIVGGWAVVTNFLNDDRGNTWKPGNHQRFRRIISDLK